MKIFSIAAAFSILFVSCKKGDNRQYSKWYVNNDSFYTNDIRVDKGNAVCQIQGNDFTNRYFLEFHLNYFPIGGSFPILCSQQNPYWACLTITYKGIGYVSPKNTNLQADDLNGKGSYVLQPAWFYNESNAQDSVLVRGTFNEP